MQLEGNNSLCLDVNMFLNNWSISILHNAEKHICNYSEASASYPKIKVALQNSVIKIKQYFNALFKNIKVMQNYP